MLVCVCYVDSPHDNGDCNGLPCMDECMESNLMHMQYVWRTKYILWSVYMQVVYVYVYVSWQNT